MSECLVKAAHIVLATRLSALGSAAPKASTRDKTNRWFNLETEEVESATNDGVGSYATLDTWRVTRAKSDIWDEKDVARAWQTSLSVLA